MKTFILGRIGVAVLCTLLFTHLEAQISIFNLMERHDLNIDQVESLAKRYFDSAGTERGTGYKQYQRWRYEVGFHLDKNGYQLPPNYDWEAYQQSKFQASTGALSVKPNVNGASGAWVEKGPFNWNRTSGWNPGVGRITSIAVHPADTTVIYVTSPGGGVWKSTNSGASWTPLTDANGSWMNMFSVSIDPSNRSTVYAGSSANVIIKSTDAGATWTAINSGMTGTIRKILIHPTNSNLVHITAGNGIWRSTNGGTTWTRVYAGAIEDIEFKPDDPNIMYASGNSALRSADGGQTWTAIDTTKGVTTTGRTLIGVSSANPNRVYLLQAYGNEFGKLYVSNDAGLTFTMALAGSSSNCTNYFGYETTGCGTGGQAGYDMAVCVNPSNADEIHIGGIIVFKSLDGGKTFSPESAWSYPNSIGYNHADVHVLEYINKTVYSGSDGGIYKLQNGTSNWTDLSKGLGVRQFYRIANSKTNSQVFTGGAQDNGSAIYNGTGWIDWLGADGMDAVISPSNSNLIWGTSQYGQVYRTTDGGNSYSTLNKPSSGEWVTPLQYDENSNALYGAWTGVYKSTDNGTTWTSISGSNITTSLTALAVAPSNPAYIYASKSTALYYTKDGGATWAFTYLPSAINFVAVSPTNPSKVYVACNSTVNRMYVSTDAGATFTDISGNLPYVIPRSIAVDNNTDETVYIGLNVGVFYKDNTTSGWIDISDNLPMVAINDLDIQKAGGLLRVGTYGRGVWERPLVGSAAISCGIPTTLAANSITTSAATISWAAVSGATSYIVDYQIAGAATWTNFSSTLTNTSATLSGLTDGTLYNWRVAAVCSTTTGDYATSQFQTVLNCQAPTSLNVTNITDVAATLSWNPVSTATNYTVEYKLNTSTTWTTAVSATTSTSVNLSGLTASTLYDWRVRSTCSAGGSINTAAQFTTASPSVCQDAFESNNTSKQSKSVSLGIKNKATINTSSDEDWFKFTTGSGSFTNVKVSLTQLPDDYDVYLYDKNNRMVGSSLNTGITDEILVYNSTATRATYYVRVIGKSGKFNATSCYNLTAETSSTPYAPAPGIALYTEEEINGAVIYPNPVNNQFSLKFKSEVEEDANIKIVSASGSILQAKDVKVYRGVNQVEFNVADLKQGLYLMQLKSGSLNIVKQVIVVR